MREQDRESVEQERPIEQVDQIIKEAAREVRVVIQETVAQVKIFPKCRVGKEGDLGASRRGFGEGTIRKLAAIWINPEEDKGGRSEIPFILTRKGLFRSRFGSFYDPEDGIIGRRHPSIDHLEESDDDEILRYGYKALSVLQNELERQKGEK